MDAFSRNTLYVGRIRRQRAITLIQKVVKKNYQKLNQIFTVVLPTRPEKIRQRPMERVRSGSIGSKLNELITVTDARDTHLVNENHDKPRILEAANISH